MDDLPPNLSLSLSLCIAFAPRSPLPALPYLLHSCLGRNGKYPTTPLFPSLPFRSCVWGKGVCRYGMALHGMCVCHVRHVLRMECQGIHILKLVALVLGRTYTEVYIYIYIYIYIDKGLIDD